MDVTPLIGAGQQIIQSYNSGGFRISAQLYDGSVFVFPEKTIGWGFDGPVGDLSIGDFEQLIEHSDQIDVVLLGCGVQMQFLPQELRGALKEAGLSVDVMDTGAACRTYNVLMAEGRRLVAALLPV